MTKIADETPVVKYIGNGVTKSFAFKRMCWEESDVLVYVGDTQVTSGYSLKYDDLADGCTVVFTTAPENGVSVVIAREIDLERLSEFEESGMFKADVANNELNHIIAGLQQVNEKSDRAVTMPITVTGVSTVLPSPLAGHTFLWNDSGTGLINSKDKFDDIISNNNTISTTIATNTKKAAASEANAKSSETKSAENLAASQEILEEIERNQTSFNTNYSTKLTLFNDNAENQTTAFNNNASALTTTFNNNASAKTTTFNNNATSKTTAYNTNAANKTAAFDADAEAATNAIKELLAYQIISGGSPGDGNSNIIIGGLLN